MALRMFLVGVVASLALDLPKGETWTRWEARLAEVRTKQQDPAMPNGVMAFASEPASACVPTIPLAPTPTLVVAESPRTEVPAASQPALVVAQPVIVVVEEPDMIDPIDLDEGEIAEVPTPVAVLPVPMVEPAPAPEVLAVVPNVPVADPDAAFRSVVDQMTSSFAAEAVPPTAEPLPLLAEAEEFADDETDTNLDPVLCQILGRSAPIALPEAVVVVEPVEVIVEQPVVVVVEPVEVVEPAAEETSSDRLARAVRLTGQAVNAWASLLQHEPAAMTIRR